MNRQQFLSSYINYLEQHSIHLNPYSDAPNFEGYDISSFCDFFNRNTFSTLKELFELYYRSLYWSLENSEIPTSLRIVEKSVENAEYVSELINFYPNAKFIHIIRNPYENLASFRRFRTVNGRYPFLGNISQALKTNYYFLFKNKRLFEDSYLHVRYEDIKDNRSDVMRRIAKFLAISYNPILERPTSRGKSWKGNSSKLNHPQKKDSTHPIEIALVNEIGKSVLEHFNYEKQDFNILKFYMPVIGERFKTYVRNRAYVKLHFV